MKPRTKHLVIISLMITGLVSSVFGVRLLSKSIALRKMMPEAQQVVEEQRKMSAEEIATIKTRLGGILIFYQADSEAEREKVYEVDEYTFYFGLQGEEKKWVAIIEVQPGKWGPVEYIVSLDAQTAKVKDLAVMSYTERRGRPIARRNFLKQFLGKTSSDPLRVRRDIRGITGATISSVATCFAVKKAMVLYEELYLKAAKSQ